MKLNHSFLFLETCNTLALLPHSSHSARQWPPTPPPHTLLPLSCPWNVEPSTLYRNVLNWQIKMFAVLFFFLPWDGGDLSNRAVPVLDRVYKELMAARR